VTATHELLTTLRRLKLSGMLDTLEARLDQARAGELGHLEFLQVLCEDELTRRDAANAGNLVEAFLANPFAGNKVRCENNPKDKHAGVAHNADKAGHKRGVGVELFFDSFFDPVCGRDGFRR